MSGHHNHNHHGLHKVVASDRLGIALLLNAVFTLIEFVGGYLTNSTAILADAVHDLGDTLAIGMAWVLSKLSNKAAGGSYTYGYKRLSLFGALINGLVLLLGSIGVLYLAIPRLFEPQMPMVEGMLVLALLGVTVNGYAAYKLSKGKTLNEKVLNWHLIEDVLGWIAVLIVSIVLFFVDWPILDPILSICFTLLILVNVAKNLIATIKLFLQAVPDPNMQQAILDVLQGLSHVQSIHRLHFWSLDGEHHVLTAHLVLQQDLSPAETNALKREIAKQLARFPLSHTTIEFEFPEESCRDQ